MMGMIKGRMRRGHQRIRWLDGITDAMDMNMGKLWEMVRDREAWHAVVHEVKSRLLLGRKVMTNLDSVLKSRDITLLTKAHIISGHVQL